MLKVLKIGAIAKSTSHVVEQCLRGRLSCRCLERSSSGWRTCFWHVMTSDSPVPPSQAQLAFYVNLRRTDHPRPRVFSRAIPGEYRISTAELPTGQLPDPSNEVKRRLRGANGLERTARGS